MVDVATATFLVAIGSGVTGLVVFALTAWGAARSQPLCATDDEVVFLFRDGRLIDATDAARQQMPGEPKPADDIARFIFAFAQRFEGLADHVARARPGESFEIAEMPDDPSSLRLIGEYRDKHLRIVLEDPLRGRRSETMTSFSLAAMRAELFTLRSVAERAPIPTWKRREDGAIIWANGSYMRLARDVAGPDAVFGWPPPDLFGAAKQSDRDGPRRVSVQVPGEEQPLWFDLIALPGEIETLFFALPIDKLVRAENALTEFVQTLTKTFADLRIGLAIFDRKRRLVLFNPALTELTALPAEQLSARPTLHAFLDALRDQQRIPEPKDYKGWRMKIAQLEAGAADGTFEETWHLANGQTFRVSGRPHPDGAVAYLFEDISTEMSKTRSYRQEIELGQAVLDGLDVAVAAFSHAGFLTLANRAYHEMWGTGLGDPTSPLSIGEAARRWQEASCPGPVPEAIRAAVLQAEDRTTWTAALTRRDGDVLQCCVRPVSGGITLVTFAPEASAHLVKPAAQDLAHRVTA